MSGRDQIVSNQVYQQPAGRQAQGHAREGYRYPKVGDRRVGKDWLSSKDHAVPVQKYREYLMAAMMKARDNFEGRLREEGKAMPKGLKTKSSAQPRLKTVDPAVPDFASQRYALHKHAGVCIKSHYQRFFTVDSENLKYYQDKQN
jgi:hypothetical protein